MTPAQFLIGIWRQQPDGWFYLATKTVNDAWRDKWFKKPTRAEVAAFIAANGDRNLYFCPTPFREPRRIKANVIGSRFLWADLDAAKPERCKPLPQIAWASSPKRYAALWRLNDVHVPEVIEPTNRALSYAIVDADKTGWDLTQVLRIPGTKNYKYPDAPKGVLLWCRNNSLPLADFPDPPLPPAVRSPIKRKGKRKPPSIRRATLWHLKQPKAYGDRSRQLWKLTNELLEAGCSDQEAFDLLWPSAWNKHRVDGRRDAEACLRRTIERARDGTS